MSMKAVQSLMDTYKELLRIHREYHYAVDRQVETAFDYFGRPLIVEKSTVPAFVYQLYSEDSLCYVGKTRTPLQRILTGPDSHRRTKFWFGDVVRIELYRFQVEKQALQAEAYDIRLLGPVHNVAKPTPPKYRPVPTHSMSFEPNDERGLAAAYYLMNPEPEGDKLE